MVQENGCLFHIDFGHFLGNFKKKFGIARERAKFVFTPDFAYVMGGADSLQFQQFVSLCCQAYNILRKHASKIIVLLAMMLSTGIPELRSPNDIDYVRNTLCLDLEEEDAAASFCRELSASLGCKTTIINNIIHILAH
jgi:phosphatidylinositol-4,5-bisphosphate 3-kinase